ncbi:XapX domain-containing protein [Tunturibacter psychrotolerans]|uniref:XapX domain-containing protein n=1 Tax=Tunturiibacter psychrotolerans TaxID=3069686 RepID=A0AAU7ZKZ7_9BACT
MRILIAFIVAFVIGAASRWTGVPSLAPQAIMGALLIVAMSTGYVSADRFLKRNPSPSATASVSTCATAELATAELATHNQEVLSHEPPAIPEPEADTTFWRQKSEALQLIIADLLLTNEQLRASEDAHSSKAPTTHTLISRTNSVVSEKKHT